MTSGRDWQSSWASGLRAMASARVTPSGRTATGPSCVSSSHRGFDQRALHARAPPRHRRRAAFLPHARVRESRCGSAPPPVRACWTRAIRPRFGACSKPRRPSSAPRSTRRTPSWAAQARHGFVPIAGLHHAARDKAAGFCVFNDCGDGHRAAPQTQWSEANRVRGHRRAPRRRRVLRVRRRPGRSSSRTSTKTGATSIPGTGRSDETGEGCRARHQAATCRCRLGPDDEVFARSMAQGDRSTWSGTSRSSSCFSAGRTAWRATPLPTCAFRRRRMGGRPWSWLQLAERLGHGRVLALGGGGI